MERLKLPNIHTPHIKFPSDPMEIIIEGHKFHDYISPTAMIMLVESFSDQVKLEWFDAVLVNQKGGVRLLGS